MSPTQILYLETPPTHDELQTVLTKLGMTARSLLRTGEPEYKSLDLANVNLSDDEIIDAMVRNPVLIERPILVVGDKAVIGRPTEKLLELLP